MDPHYQIIPTTDGSHTIYLPHLDETYHSRHGALEESMHVFIRQGLEKLSAKTSVCIFEVGFGTGLNCLLTILNSTATLQDITYYTIEPFPLPAELTEQLNYTGQLPAEAVAIFKAIHQAPWDQAEVIRPGFTLHKMRTTLADMQALERTADLVYYDAFAPSKQAELWHADALKKVKEQMHEGAILTTYCAQGQFKRNLKALGFSLQHPPGANGKREMTIAFFNAFPAS